MSIFLLFHYSICKGRAKGPGDLSRGVLSTVHEACVRIPHVESRTKGFAGLFFEEVGKPVLKAVPLSEHSCFRIGGPADYFFEVASPAELKAALRAGRLASIPYYVIGGGSNLLFDDEGFRGLIIKNRIKGIRVWPERDAIEAFSGSGLADLVMAAMREGLEGLEFLAGIPGTVGGAVCGNAGAFGRSTGDSLERAILLGPEGEESEARREDLGFDYRSSRLKTSREILVRGDFQLGRGDKDKVNRNIRDILAKREAKQPHWTTACAGSYFKNPVTSDGVKVAAGRLLDEVGAKSLSVGRAAVYPGHANFIINLDRATSRDVLKLAGELKERVKTRFGVDLEEEVIHLPAIAEGP